jgi:hypothetical protein
VLGGYTFIVRNITDSTILNNTTITAIVTSNTIMNSFTFTAAAGKIYEVSASTYDSSVVPTPTPTPTPTNTATPTPTPTNTATPTPTATSTPTPTPTSTTYDVYTADEYTCSGCSVIANGVLVAFPSGQTVSIGSWYPDGNDPSHSYKITGTSTGSGYILTNIYGSYGTCTVACAL